MLLLLRAGLVQKCFFYWEGLGWGLINFLGFQGGQLFEAGAYLKVGG